MGIEKTKEELDLQYGRGLILIFAGILCAIACSLLNWALWGETKINIGMVGSISVFAAMFTLLHFYMHLEKASTKSKEERAVIANNLGDLSISQQNYHNELIEIISLTNLKISRIETVHGFFYTTEQIKSLYKNNIPLNITIWKAKQIEAYYRIMTGKGIRPADHDEFKDHDGKYLSMKVQAYTMNELYPELMGKSRENMIRQSRKEVKQVNQIQDKLMSENKIKN
ncbi:MAG: papain-like cysteine protease family protein [Victivallaceae bacterium]